MDNKNKSGHLVAPELLAGLEVLSQININAEFLQLVRGLPLDAALVNRPPLTEQQAAVRCEQRFIPHLDAGPDVRVLVYTPPGDVIRPLLFHLHGGGYVLGSPEINDASNRTQAHSLNCVVVSVDYRLAPETNYVGSQADCYSALVWAYREADRLGIDTNKITLTGESAGGGHAAALAIRARDGGEVPVAFLLLDSPMLDDRTGSGNDQHAYCGEFVWTAENNRFGWQCHLGMEPGTAAVPEAAAPARARDLSGLPPTFIVVGAIDLFAEEDMEFARRLMRVGVPTELHIMPGAYHGFAVAGEQAPQVKQLLSLKRQALARMWTG